MLSAEPDEVEPRGGGALDDGGASGEPKPPRVPRRPYFDCVRALRDERAAIMAARDSALATAAAAEARAAAARAAAAQAQQTIAELAAAARAEEATSARLRDELVGAQTVAKADAVDASRGVALLHRELRGMAAGQARVGDELRQLQAFKRSQETLRCAGCPRWVRCVSPTRVSLGCAASHSVKSSAAGASSSHER